VSLARAFLEDLAVNALSVIADPHPEELAIVRDLGLNAARVCVLKGISKDLARATSCRKRIPTGQNHRISREEPDALSAVKDLLRVLLLNWIGRK